jgi:hypothetical protein
MPKVLIATPAPRVGVTTEFSMAIAQTISHLEGTGVKTAIDARRGWDVSETRDVLAHRFLASDSSHLLFVDADVAPHEALCSKLLATKLDLVGAACPQRVLNLEKFWQYAVNGLPFGNAQDRVRGIRRRDDSVKVPDETVWVPPKSCVDTARSRSLATLRRVVDHAARGRERRRSPRHGSGVKSVNAVVPETSGSTLVNACRSRCSRCPTLRPSCR